MDLGPTPTHDRPDVSPENGLLKPIRSRVLAAGNVHFNKPVVRLNFRFQGEHPGTYQASWWREVVLRLPNLRRETLEFPSFAVFADPAGPVPAAAAVEFLSILLQRSTGWPVHFMASIGAVGHSAHAEVARPVAIFETRHKAAGLRAGRIALDMLGRLEAASVDDFESIFAQGFGSFRRKTRAETPSRHVIWIARRAECRGISWSVLSACRFLRLGRGRYAETLQNYDTSVTSCVAKGLAKRKDIARQLLADAGLPVAKQRVARSATAAVAAATAIGFPVVVKPMDGSEGRAVSVDLTTEKEVVEAYAKTTAISSSAVVESVIPGEAFRLSIIGGRFFAAAERHPPRVRGDGARTVEELIAEENQNPERIPANHASLKPIILDDEMLAFLTRQGLSPTAVPEAERWVPLRRVPNPPYGPKTDVTDITHPTIRSMAERVAALVGLSVCGIDFVTTDITRPYEETGGAICEVNNMPDLGLHRLVSEGPARDGADAVLDMLFPAGRRSSFPVIAVLREETDSNIEDVLRAAWEGRGYKVGLASALDDAAGSGGLQARFENRLRALDLDTEVDLAIVALSPRQMVDWGLGFEAVDLAVLPVGSGSSVAKRARRAAVRVAAGRTLALDDPDLARRSFEAVELGRKLQSAKRKAWRFDPPSAGDQKAAVRIPTAKRLKPAIMPLDSNIKLVRSARLQAGEPVFLRAGNIHARRTVMELPILGGGEALVPTTKLRRIAAVLPPLSESVPNFGGWRRVINSADPVPVAAMVEVLAVAVQRYANWPVRFCAWRSGAGEAGRDNSRAVFEVATPAVGRGAARIAVALASALLDDAGPGELQATFLEEVWELRQSVEQGRAQGDGLEIAREASARGISWSLIENSDFVRLGSGRFSHLIVGSETTKTPLIGYRLAQSKRVTCGLLAATDLPVPRQLTVRTEEEALKAAGALGFPLVVKPVAGNQGRAVTVGVTSESGLLSALQRAKAISPEAVVETFIPGNEYRLLVVGGRFVAAACRRPAQVRGDGVSTVRALVESENARPERNRRLAGRARSLVPIALDDEALALLSEQGYAPETVPAEDQVVFLRRQSNYSCGGDTVDATDDVHPAVRQMAERVAALLGIDVCGIDFITTDIGKPPEETGAAICKVNTRPSLRLHHGVSQGKARNVAAEIVNMLFPAGTPSRCPVVVLADGGEAGDLLRRAVEKAAARAGKTLGVVCTREAGIAGPPEGLLPNTRLFRNVGGIACDQEVDAVLVLTSAAEVAEYGIGLERIDLAILPMPQEDPTLAAAYRALGRVAGGKILPLGHPATRRRALAALGLISPTGTNHGRAKTPAASAKAKQAALPSRSETANPTDALPPETDLLRPKGANAVVLMVGDIGFGECYAHLPSAAGLLRLLDEQGYHHSLARLEGLLSSADMVIGNLEVPLSLRTDSALRGRKKYLGWSDPDRTVAALQKAGIQAVSLANNHTLDCGAAGLEETIARLKAAGIASFGAGDDQAAADQPFIKRFIVGGEERSLVVFGGFEHRDRYQNRYRWYARPSAPGINRLSAERIAACISVLRNQLPAPTFLAYPHWGEDYTGVNDLQREEAARLIDAGVDLIIGHGTHVAQAVEMVSGRPVVFGLGNFVWNSPGRYGRFGAPPYSLAAALIFQGKRSGGGMALRLYPLLTDNTVTNFQSRPVAANELADAMKNLVRGIEVQTRRRSRDAGPYLELKLNASFKSSVIVSSAGKDREAGDSVLMGLN